MCFKTEFARNWLQRRQHQTIVSFALYANMCRKMYHVTCRGNGEIVFRATQYGILCSQLGNQEFDLASKELSLCLKFA